MLERRLRLSRRTCRLLERLVKQPVSSDEIRLLLRNLSEEEDSVRRPASPPRGRACILTDEGRDTHRFLRGRAGKELALISTMMLLLRSSVSRARKGPSCSAEILVILLFALKTRDTVAPINDKNTVCLTVGAHQGCVSRYANMSTSLN